VLVSADSKGVKVGCFDTDSQACEPRTKDGASGRSESGNRWAGDACVSFGVKWRRQRSASLSSAALQKQNKYNR
jgi:hypothetical protein